MDEKGCPPLGNGQPFLTTLDNLDKRCRVFFLPPPQHLIMPFRRRRTRRRTRRRPTALRAVRRLAKFVDTELQQSLFFADNVSASDTGLLFTLAAIAQGTDDVNRIGFQASMVRLEARILIERGNTDSCIRLLLVIDKQTNGAFPTVNDLLQVTGSGNQKVTSPMSNENRLRFTVLSDRVYSLVTGHSTIRCFPIRKRLTHKMRFDGPGQGIVDIVSGSIILLAIATTTGAAASPTISMVSRLWFAP